MQKCYFVLNRLWCLLLCQFTVLSKEFPGNELHTECTRYENRTIQVVVMKPNLHAHQEHAKEKETIKGRGFVGLHTRYKVTKGNNNRERV